MKNKRFVQLLLKHSNLFKKKWNCPGIVYLSKAGRLQQYFINEEFEKFWLDYKGIDPSSTISFISNLRDTDVLRKKKNEIYNQYKAEYKKLYKVNRSEIIAALTA
jgi:hypothetical protein